jgi:hypothetical protein
VIVHVSTALAATEFTVQSVRVLQAGGLDPRLRKVDVKNPATVK